MTTHPHHFDPADPHDRHAAELDLARGMHASSARKAGWILVITVVLMALFNAQGLAKWSQKLPETDAADQVVLATLEWQGWMEAIGTARVFAAVRRAFYALREM